MNGETPETGGDYPEPRRLRHLRWLVTALTVTLIVGVITVVTLLVIRLNRMAPSAPAPPLLPLEVTLPEGETAQALTLGSDWLAVVTIDALGTERIRVLDRASGAERGLTLIAPAP